MKTSRVEKSRVEEHPVSTTEANETSAAAKAAAATVVTETVSDSEVTDADKTSEASEADNLETMALFTTQIDSRTRCSRETPGPAADREDCCGTGSAPKAEAEPTSAADDSTRLRR